MASKIGSEFRARYFRAALATDVASGRNGHPISQPKQSVLSTINFGPDCLPKLRDFPAAIGGSGEMIAE
jgi:hypothetical protein